MIYIICAVIYTYVVYTLGHFGGIKQERTFQKVKVLKLKHRKRIRSESNEIIHLIKIIGINEVHVYKHFQKSYNIQALYRAQDIWNHSHYNTLLEVRGNKLIQLPRANDYSI